MLTTPRLDLHTSCGRFLPLVDSAYLDCVSDAVALVLAHAGVADIRAAFAVDWRFELAAAQPGAASLPRLDLPPADQDARLAARTGYAPQWRPLPTLDEALPSWLQLLAAGRPVIVVGDAFHLPWVPYAGHEHLEHAFVLEGVRAREGQPLLAHVVDPYDNTTQWGRAVPLTTTLPITELSAGVAGGRWAVLAGSGPGGSGEASTVDAVASRVAANAAAIAGAGAQRGHFMDAHREPDEPALANLTLQTWLLARSRGLHGRWLADVAGQLRARTDSAAPAGPAGGWLDAFPDLPERFDERVTAAWQRAAQACYIALRRVRSGRAVPPGCLAATEQALAAEAELAAELLAGRGC